MKVLKKGRKQESVGWSGKFECKGTGNGDTPCGALLLVGEDDVFGWVMTDGMTTERLRVFICPDCAVVTYLPLNDAPDRANGTFDDLVRMQTAIKRGLKARASMGNVVGHER